MSKRILLHTLIGAALLAGASTAAQAQKVTFQNVSLPAITVTPEKNTGLDAIYVLYSTKGVKATFSMSGVGNGAQWYRYSNLGAGYAEAVSGVTYDGDSSSIQLTGEDMGYYVEYNSGSRFYFWVTDYEQHRFFLKGVQPTDNQECENTTLNLDFTGTPLKYYTINGQSRNIDQQIKVEYYNLEWNQETELYDQTSEVHNLEHPQDVVTLFPAVLCQTTFKVRGDRFLEEWDWAEEVTSSPFQPHAVGAETKAVQDGIDDGDDETEKEPSNQISSSTEGLGGSAPAYITFSAFTTDGVLHNEWQFSTDPDFNTITYRFNVKDLDYTFTEEGVTYVRYIGSNSDGTCETVSETYEVSIGASELKCPNAFSPGASEGVNDVWKVAYRSLVEFKCHIFDRYGKLLYSFDDPTQGWDGKYKGKLVKPGVYYYVIEALGADGKKYKKSGDINIIGHKIRENSGSASDDVVE